MGFAEAMRAESFSVDKDSGWTYDGYMLTYFLIYFAIGYFISLILLFYDPMDDFGNNMSMFIGNTLIWPIVIAVALPCLLVAERAKRKKEAKKDV